MAEIDDFELIDDETFPDEPTFVFVDGKSPTEKPTNTVTTLPNDPVLPLLIPKPLIEVVEEQPPNAITTTVQPETPVISVDTSIPVTTFTPIKKTIVQVPSTPRVFAPVPLLPKAPPLKRFGAAATIPYSINAPLDIDTIISKSRETQQTTLHNSTRQQQHIQTLLEQRRRTLNKTN